MRVLTSDKKDKQIDFLVDRKFHGHRNISRCPPPVESTSGESTGPDSEKFFKEIEKYKSSLYQLTKDEFQALLNDEQEKQQREWMAKQAEEERARFFNQPHSDADFEHWSKFATWTLEEAVALSFGKNPELVDWLKLKELGHQSPFVKKYRKTRELVKRAQMAKQINDPITPGSFIAWTRKVGIDFPRGLIDEVVSHGHVITDWKDRYDQLNEQYESLKEAHAIVTAELNHLAANNSQLDLVIESEYLQELLNKARIAINEYPVWKKSQREIQKTANLQNWVKERFSLTHREAQLVRRIMGDIIEDLR